MDVGLHPGVVVDEEHRIAGRTVDPEVALTRKPGGSGMDVIKTDAGPLAKRSISPRPGVSSLESTMQSSAGSTVCATRLRIASRR